MSAPTVLVLAEAEDATAGLVAEALTVRGAAVSWVDTADFPRSLLLVARPQSVDEPGYLDVQGERVDLARVRSIYRRSPARFRFPDGMSGPERQFATAEAVAGLGGVLGGLPCRWLDHPGRMADAGYKPRQLRTAAVCGLRVPRSLVTNVRAAAREFATEVGRVVYKSLSPGVLSENGRVTLLNTTPVTADDLDDPALELTACLIQEWVPKAHDVRLTAVGDRCYAVAIHTDSPAARIDWRTDYDTLHYQVCPVPDDVRRGVVEYLRMFGLTFGAFDFSVTPDGGWWFLECNPNGQWGWLAEQTGIPVADAIADQLLKEAS